MKAPKKLTPLQAARNQVNALQWESGSLRHKLEVAKGEASQARCTAYGITTEIGAVRRERDEAVQARDAASRAYADEKVVNEALVARNAELEREVASVRQTVEVLTGEYNRAREELALAKDSAGDWALRAAFLTVAAIVAAVLAVFGWTR